MAYPIPEVLHEDGGKFPTGDVAVASESGSLE